MAYHLLSGFFFFFFAFDDDVVVLEDLFVFVYVCLSVLGSYLVVPRA